MQSRVGADAATVAHFLLRASDRVHCALLK